jgi:methylenetetrahydrofolate/methylenetetrahydromethanopterin dehydrogenase (NADP+)
MSKRRILIQLDSDHHPSVFDAVVATDSGVDCLLQYGGVEPTDVRDLVHGAIFTRGADDLENTAIFIGGSSVKAGEELLKQVKGTFFGPMRVSVLLDANGANTTAAAAVLAAAKHVDLCTTVVVLGGTGPVGERIALLLMRRGAQVVLCSRMLGRAEETCDRIRARLAKSGVDLSSFPVPVECASQSDSALALDGAEVVIAAGASGVELVSKEALASIQSLKVAIDLNAVPPAGIAGIEVTDKAKERDGLICYGAIGVGGTKMKIHRAAIQRLFTANNLILDAEQVFQIAQEL